MLFQSEVNNLFVFGFEVAEVLEDTSVVYLFIYPLINHKNKRKILYIPLETKSKS